MSRLSLARRVVARSVVIPSIAVAVVGIAGCAGEQSTLETLPPIRTTIAQATTTTTIDDRRKFYEVKSGDTLADIARSFAVPTSELAALNDFQDGQVLQIGQLLQIPTDVVIIECLPEPPADTVAP